MSKSVRITIAALITATVATFGIAAPVGAAAPTVEAKGILCC